MATEIEIAKARAATSAPEHRKSAPPNVIEAGNRYQNAAKQFDDCLLRIRSYNEHHQKIDVAVNILTLVDEAQKLAAEVRSCAEALRDFHDSFIRVGSDAIFLSSIAAAAEEAYQGRMAALEILETALAKLPRSDEGTRPFPLLDLRLHEGVKGGHLGKRHVAKTMEDFKQRWSAAEKRGKILPILSSFIGDPQLGITDSRVVEIVSRAIHLARKQIDSAKEGKRFLININELSDVGYVKERGKPPRFTKSGQLVVIKDSSHPDHIRILTAELGETNE